MRAWVAAAALVAAGSLLSVPAALGDEDQATGEEDQAAAAASEPAEFKVPPGFRKKQRGKHTVYCRKETPMGTRMQQEKCYDEQGLREMETALREEREKIDQMRRVCSSSRYCGAG